MFRRDTLQLHSVTSVGYWTFDELVSLAIRDILLISRDGTLDYPLLLLFPLIAPGISSARSCSGDGTMATVWQLKISP